MVRHKNAIRQKSHIYKQIHKNKTGKMKKKYLKPEIKAYAIAPDTLLAGSINETQGTTENVTESDFDFGDGNSNE